MAEAIFFLVFTVPMLLAALAVVTSRRPIYSVLALFVVMFNMACLFVMLGAYFVAALQILIYAGAVLVLFLFAIMLLNLHPEALSRARMFTMPAIGFALGAFLFVKLLQGFWATASGEPFLFRVPMPDLTVKAVGRALFTDYLLPFELVSFLILAAIIGAVTLAKQKSSKK